MTSDIVQFHAPINTFSLIIYVSKFNIAALVIAHTPKEKQPGNTNTAVNNIATYLRGKNM